MGVGNWSWRSDSGLSTFVSHVDDLPETFEQYRAQAESAWIEHARSHHASLIVDDVVPDIAWALENLHEADVAFAIEDEFPYWNDQEGYAINASAARFDDLIDGLRDALRRSSFDGTEGIVHLKHADDALRIGHGRMVDVVAKPWESMIYLAVGPSAKLENQGKIVFNPAVERFLAMHLSACAPQKKSFYELSASQDFRFEMSERVVALLRDGRRFSAASDLLDATVELARTLESSGTVEECDDFERRFGMEPSAVTMQSTTDEIDILFDYVEAIGELPTTVDKAYQIEYEMARDAVLEYLSLSNEEVYQPTTGWTSKRLDLSGFHEVALVSVNAGQLGIIRSGPIGASLTQLTPYLGVEQVAFVKASSLGGLQDRIRDAYPQIDNSVEGIHALFSAGPGHGGVAVVDAGCLDVFRHRSPAKIAHDAAGFLRDGLPAWLEPVVDPKGLRDVAEAVASLPGLNQRLYASNGDLTVAGMLVLRTGGNVQSLYVTDDPVPSARSAYRPVVIHGHPAMDFEREARLAKDSSQHSPGFGR